MRTTMTMTKSMPKTMTKTLPKTMTTTRVRSMCVAIACTTLCAPIAAMSSATPVVPSTAAPTRWITTAAGAPCDRHGNHAVVLRNAHPSRDMLVAVRWNVQGGKTTRNRFRSNAGSAQEIGCAAGIRVVDAQYVAEGDAP